MRRNFESLGETREKTVMLPVAYNKQQMPNHKQFRSLELRNHTKPLKASFQRSPQRVEPCVAMSQTLQVKPPTQLKLSTNRLHESFDSFVKRVSPTNITFQDKQDQPYQVYYPATGSGGSKEQQQWLMRKRIQNLQSKQEQHKGCLHKEFLERHSRKQMLNNTPRAHLNASEMLSSVQSLNYKLTAADKDTLLTVNTVTTQHSPVAQKLATAHLDNLGKVFRNVEEANRMKAQSPGFITISLLQQNQPKIVHRIPQAQQMITKEQLLDVPSRTFCNQEIVTNDASECNDITEMQSRLTTCLDSGDIMKEIESLETFQQSQTEPSNENSQKVSLERPHRQIVSKKVLAVIAPTPWSQHVAVKMTQLKIQANHPRISPLKSQLKGGKKVKQNLVHTSMTIPPTGFQGVPDQRSRQKRRNLLAAQHPPPNRCSGGRLQELIHPETWKTFGHAISLTGAITKVDLKKPPSYEKYKFRRQIMARVSQGSSIELNPISKRQDLSDEQSIKGSFGELKVNKWNLNSRESAQDLPLDVQITRKEQRQRRTSETGTSHGSRFSQERSENLRRGSRQPYEQKIVNMNELPSADDQTFDYGQLLLSQMRPNTEGRDSELQRR